MNMKQLLQKHADLELRRAAAEECLTLIRSEFSSRDGIPPKSIVLTQDGKRVPPSTFNEILDQITNTVLFPILNEMSALEEKKLK